MSWTSFLFFSHYDHLFSLTSNLPSLMFSFLPQSVALLVRLNHLSSLCGHRRPLFSVVLPTTS